MRLPRPRARHAAPVLLGGLAVLTTAPAGAQLPVVHLRAGVGATIPRTADGRNGTAGVHGLLALQVKPPALPVGARLDLAATGLPAQGGAEATLLLSGTANVVYTPFPIPVVTPYVIGGVGRYHQTGGGAGTRTGYNAGVGLTLQLIAATVFAEARIHQLPARGAAPSRTFIPLTVGLRL